MKKIVLMMVALLSMTAVQAQESDNNKNQQQFQPGALERPDAPEPTTFVPSTNLVDSSASPVPNTFSSPLFNVKGAGLFDNKPVN